VSRSHVALGIFITAWLVIALSPASAFKEALDLAPGSPLGPQRAGNPEVIVFDNDYLGRRFGRSGVPETTRNENANTVTSEGSDVPIFPLVESQTIDLPAKRSSEVLPNHSLLRAIKSGTPARQAAALRLAETGRTLLQKGQYRKAIYYLEKALSVDANPFIHFYLARAHYRLADYQGSQRFLEVAESGFYGQPDWLPELETLRRELSVHRYTPPAVTPRNVGWNFNQ
jgi:tetratricopeptide (TPR) repeat protein